MTGTTDAPELVGRDVYFRRIYAGSRGPERGPVLYARVWCAMTFLSSESDRGKHGRPTEHYTVELAGETNWRAELRR